jgi:hypothetical protein
MRLLGTRRAALVAGVATVAAIALTGCSAGQVAETALKRPSNSGLNADTADGSVAIRNLAVVYNGSAGYPAGGNAPLEVALFNQTTTPIVVTVTTRPAANAGPEAGIVSGTMVGLVGDASAEPAQSATPEPSGSRPPATPDTETPDNVEPSSGAPEVPSNEPTAPSEEPSSGAPAAQPARITIPAVGYQSFLPGDDQQLMIMGLTDRLLPGTAVNLVFEFSNGAPALTVPAPMNIPLSPASRAPGNEAEEVEPE